MTSIFCKCFYFLLQAELMGLKRKRYPKNGYPKDDSVSAIFVFIPHVIDVSQGSIQNKSYKKHGRESCQHRCAFFFCEILRKQLQRKQSIPPDSKPERMNRLNIMLSFFHFETVCRYTLKYHALIHSHFIFPFIIYCIHFTIQHMWLSTLLLFLCKNISLLCYFS